MKAKFSIITMFVVSLLCCSTAAMAGDEYTVPPNSGLKLTLDQLPAANYGIYCSVINDTNPNVAISTYLSSNVPNAKYFVNSQETPSGMGSFSSFLNTVFFKNVNLSSGAAGKYLIIQNTNQTYPFYVTQCYANQE